MHMFACAPGFRSSCAHVCTRVLVLNLLHVEGVSIGLCMCTCVCDHIVMQANLAAFPAVPELELRGPALSPGVDKRPIFKEH